MTRVAAAELLDLDQVHLSIRSETFEGRKSGAQIASISRTILRQLSSMSTALQPHAPAPNRLGTVVWSGVCL